MITVVEQTREEKLEMLMKSSKKKLAEMLIESNNRLECLKKVYILEAEAAQYGS